MELKNKITEHPMDGIGTSSTASIKEEKLSYQL